MFGIIFNVQATALNMVQMFNLIANAASGINVNIGKGASPQIKFFAATSPMRYGCELAMRRITSGKHLQ